MNVFLAGPDLIRWNLDVVDSTDGRPHVRLTMRHPHGSIVEYFATTGTALDRQHELEHLLIGARGFAEAGTESVR